MVILIIIVMSITKKLFINHNSVGSNVDYFITVKQQLTTHNHLNIFIELVSYEKSVTFYLVTMEVINYTRLRENKRKKINLHKHVTENC